MDEKKYCVVLTIFLKLLKEPLKVHIMVRFILNVDKHMYIYISVYEC